MTEALRFRTIEEMTQVTQVVFEVFGVVSRGAGRGWLAELPSILFGVRVLQGES